MNMFKQDRACIWYIISNAFHWSWWWVIVLNEVEFGLRCGRRWRRRKRPLRVSLTVHQDSSIINVALVLYNHYHRCTVLHKGASENSGHQPSPVKARVLHWKLEKSREDKAATLQTLHFALKLYKEMEGMGQYGSIWVIWWRRKGINRE